MMLKRKIQKQNTSLEKQIEKETIAPMISFCSNCGLVTTVFHPGEFVLVSIPSQRPYYGRIISVKDDGGNTVVKLATNSVETETSDIKYIFKVAN